MEGVGWGNVAGIDKGKCASGARVWPLAKARVPVCPGLMLHWNHHCHSVRDLQYLCEEKKEADREEQSI